MKPARKFKIIVNSKECGICSGPTPSAVAKKVVKKLCGNSSKAVRFSLKECKRGCERVCGPYQGQMEKLDRPYKRGGKTITHRVVCGKVRKMRGGDLGQDGESLTMDDFKVESSNNDVSFFKEHRDGTTKEQYIFFNPINFNQNIPEYSESNRSENNLSQVSTENLNRNSDSYYEYVVIRTKDEGFIRKTRNVYFKKLINQTPEKVEPKDINLKTLKKLFDQINEKIQNRKLVADTIQNELKKILKNRISELNNKQNNLNNNKQNNSDFKNSFKISKNYPKKIFVLEKGKRTSKLFGNKKQYIFFHRVESNNTEYYQYVVIRDENKRIIFKNFELNEVNIEDIPDNILLELLNEINEYRQEKRNKNFATTIMDKLREYLHYNNRNLNRYFRVPNRLTTEDMFGDFFYIKTIKKDKKYYIAFKPVNNINKRTIEYEYMVIIDEHDGIIFIKKETSSDSSHIHKISINNIPIDVLYDLYSELSKTHVDNIDILKSFLDNLLNFTTDYGKYKEWVESILKNPIRKTRNGNKITNLNKQNHDIEYFGKFSFDFISKYNPKLNNHQSAILKQWLETILEKQQIQLGKKQNTYIFKPKIESIKSSINNYNRERIVV